ncbi:hypothetical protein CYY_001065 [Polysphondylium violaceum]|uniref:Transmembrane protein n=1 Tax=Polysphondylium violaceum TaxID=133409 RepID=A0A8J4Q2K5_9MYCE|nr:hypothetical protein CYY_001065 [Polysphondylium violaceum]
MGVDIKSFNLKSFIHTHITSGFKIVDRRLVRKRLYGLALGQVMSIMIAGTGIFSQLLVVKYGVNIPTAQSTLNYVLLSLYCFVLLKRGVLWETIKTKSIYFAPLALVDLEANYVVVKAYQYTTITSIMLLDCFTIPCVVVLSRIFLKTRYTFVHISAVVLSIAGMVILFISDLVQGESANGGSNPILGDFLCLISSVLYSISNVGQEATVKKYDRITYLAMIGLYGSIFSGVQLAILERKELQTMAWSGGVIGYIVGFALCLFIMYSFAPIMMEVAGATLMNLSLLTSDIFGIFAAIFLFDRELSWLYFLSFVVIVSGLAIYNLSQPHAKSSEVQNLISQDQQQQQTLTPNGASTPELCTINMTPNNSESCLINHDQLDDHSLKSIEISDDIFSKQDKELTSSSSSS